jgi:hypothetical protein
MVDPEAVVERQRLEEAITEGRQTVKDLHAAVTLAKEEMNETAKNAARRYLAKAFETAAGSLREALRGGH